MTATMANGRSRKSLADQIDRLDSLLDGLSDGLQEAIADAVKQAVQAVLSEVLSKPELLARLQPVQQATVAAEEVRPQSNLVSRAWDWVRSGLLIAAEKVQICRSAVGQACQTGCKKVNEAGRQVKRKMFRFLIAGACGLFGARHLAGPVLAAAVLGGLTGVAAYYLGPWVAAGVSGAGVLRTVVATPASGTRLRGFWPWRTATE